MSAFWNEVRQTLRGFLARPMFVAVTVLTLGLGIGANTAIFSAVDALLLRSLPYPDSDRLVMLWSDGRERGFAQQDVVNPGVMKEWERSLTTAESVAGLDFWDTTLTTGEGAVFVKGAMASWNLFETLGVPLKLGRGFMPEEDVENGPPVVVVRHEFWQRQLGGDPNVLGRSLELDRKSWTVVGVLPKGFTAPTLPEAEVFRPLQSNLDPEDGFYLLILGRLKPGVSIEQADAELDSVQARLGAEYPELRKLSGYVQPLQEVLVQDVSRQLLVLLGATLFVLLIACANIANLLLARAIGRARELALRAAIGASRRHIVRQVLIESMSLSFLGMALGTGFAWYAIQWIESALPPGLAERVTLGVDLRVLGFALAITLLTGLVAGIIPAVIACRRDPGTALRDGERGSSGGEGRRARALLVTGTFALALALTASAGLFLKSLLRILDVDPGFRAEGLFVYSLRLPEAAYADRDALVAAQDALQSRLAAVPGVDSVGFTSTLPMGGLITDTGTAIEGVPLEGDPYRTWYSRVSPGYLAALGTPLLRGRDFAAADRADAPCVVIANETYSQRYIGSTDPVGRRVLLRPRSDEPLPCEIVGLVRDLRFNALSQPADPTLYLPNGLFPNRRFFVVMRTQGDPASLLPAVRKAVAEFDTGLAVWDPSPMTALVEDSMRTPRLVAMLVGVFAVLALTLAASGVYGVATYNVNARMREFGVRTALGARQFDLLREVMASGLKLIAGGMLLGVMLTAAFGHVLGALLYEVEPFDLEVFAAVAMLLIAAGSLAMLLPARRAARVHPMEALRYE